MTKNEFYANFFLEEIEKLKGLIKDFAQKDESSFGAEIEPDKNLPLPEQLDQLEKWDPVLDQIIYINDLWENCVAKNATEGYPVCDEWNEENQ